MAKLDSVLLATLDKQGIDKSRITLAQDYGKSVKGVSSPYAQIFADALSIQKFMVISALPMVDAFGQAHEIAWKDKNGVIENGNNIFHGIIRGLTTRLVLLSPQPSGLAGGEELSYHPQLFIGTTEIQPISETPKLINDPLNGNYAYNTLEWDYGVCIRRIRIIEGRFLGSWVFTAAPKGDITIKYNQSGKLRLNLQYAKDDDTEFIPKSYFDSALEWPVIISDSATFYPDADAESTCVDGDIRHSTTTISWADLRVAAGTTAYPSATTMYTPLIGCSATTNLWANLYRGFTLFNTSTLGAGAIVSAATLTLTSNGKGGNNVALKAGLYGSNPASNTDLVAGDFDAVSATPLSDTTFVYATWNSAGDNVFTLNAAGIAAIPVDGISKFVVRDVDYDVGGGTPYWGSLYSSYFRSYTAEQGVGYQPALAVTYTPAAGGLSIPAAMHHYKMLRR